MAPVLEVRGLSKRYAGTSVLDALDLTLEEGTAAVITGRSGSGKSTLFKLLAGLDRPTDGTVRVEGRDIAALPDEELSRLRLSRIGLVFQSYNLLPDLDVLENVRLPLDIAGVPRREAATRAQELLDLVGLGPQARQLPNSLSGGQSQRAAVARALVNRPAIILADEPTGSLDRENALNVLDLLRKVNRELRATLLVITHDPLAIAAFDERWDLDQGRLVRVSHRASA